MYFGFVLHITEHPFGRKMLPDKFAEFLDGREMWNHSLNLAIIFLFVQS
jgi:hypothetical protein